MKQVDRYRLEVLSPIHVGCDEVYEPTSFVVDEQNCRFIVFEALDLIRSLSSEDKERFSTICQKGTVSSILEVYQFLRGRKIPGRGVAACPGLVRHYQRTLSLPPGKERNVQQELSNFAISRTAFAPDTDRPYIPGSALKGSIRTAYLNGKARLKSIPPMEGKKDARELEKALLDGGSFATDPFRMLKMSDFMPVGEVRTRVLYAVNEKKTPSMGPARGPYQIFEVIEPGSVFHGWISVEQPERNAGIRSPLQIDEVFKSIDRFFSGQKAREDAEFRQMDIVPLPVGGLKGGHLLRVGRHSGAESVTIEGHRSIKILGQKAPSDRATTLWLAAQEARPAHKKNLEPLGWVLLQRVAPEAEPGLVKQETLWRQNHDKARQQRIYAEAKRREERLEQRRIADEEAKQQALDEERRRLEEARRQEELAAMSPEQRAVATIKNPQVTEQEVVEIFQRFGELEDKAIVAQALKEYWVEQGKWKKKDCSKKQWAKVQRVKKILDEN